jgi:hypothetical protein
MRGQERNSPNACSNRDPLRQARTHRRARTRAETCRNHQRTQICACNSPLPNARKGGNTGAGECVTSMEGENLCAASDPAASSCQPPVWRFNYSAPAGGAYNLIGMNNVCYKLGKPTGSANDECKTGSASKCHGG